MEVFVDRTGQRVFINQPRPDQADRNLILYSPNNYEGLDCGLYERARPPCSRWVDLFHQREKRWGTRPQYEVDRDGRTIYPASRFPAAWPPYLPSPYR